MRRLIVMRHAKAVPHVSGDGDILRALEPRGRREAALTARALVAVGIAEVDLALVSAARRCAQTWAEVAPILPAARVESDRALYHAAPDDLLDRLAAAENADAVIVIGHNPGLKELAQSLADGPGRHDAAGRRRLARGFPTAYAAVFAVAGGLARGGARLEALIAPEGRVGAS